MRDIKRKSRRSGNRPFFCIEDVVFQKSGKSIVGPAACNGTGQMNRFPKPLFLKQIAVK